MKKIKILHFPISNGKGGITQYVLQNWFFIDKLRFQFDFATMSKSLSFSDVIRETGSKIYYISCYAEENREKFSNEFRRILSENQYDIVHLHTKQWKSFLVEQIAGEFGVRKIIIHAHSTGIDTLDKDQREKEIRLHNDVLRQLTEDTATDFWSCSHKASAFLFGTQIPEKRIKIMENAIRMPEYLYDAGVRKTYRKEMNISEDECVIGNVGRFVYPKNQEFLIEVFDRLCQRSEWCRQRFRLIFVGSGEREQELRRMVSEKQLDDRVIFTGQRDDVSRLLQAMDIFCLPSRFEGFPISLVEAQASGLMCIVSNQVTREVDLTGSLYYECFDSEEWVNRILKIADQAGKDRRVVGRQILNSRYNIEYQIKEIEKNYMEGVL